MSENTIGVSDRFVGTVKRNHYVRTAAWQTGRFVHHTVPKVLGSVHSRHRTGPRVSDSREYEGSKETIPTYPYRRTSSDPLELRPDSRISNPILTGADVTDYGAAKFVADPFLFVTDEGTWHLFFEVFNHDRSPTAVIGHASSGDDMLSWEYDQVVLETEEHLSFPYVFKWDGTHYMIPESGGPNGTAVHLYEAVRFPTEWRYVSTPVSNGHGTDDTAVFRWNNRWWAIVGDSVTSNRLHVYYSDSLRSDEWNPHDANPVVTNRPNATRPAGRPIVRGDQIIAFYQDCANQYGDKVRAFEITELTSSSYADRELEQSPILEGTDQLFGWSSGRMHHIDPWYVDGRWYCAVDGNIGTAQSVLSDNHWSIGLYVADSSAEHGERDS